MTFRFIEEHRGQWPVRLLCETLEVSTAGYYAWRDRPASDRARRRDTLLVEIRAIHAEVKARYGSPRIHAELVARGQDCCVNTVARLMHDHDLRAKTARKFRCTTDSNHDLPVAANLLDRQFNPAAANEAWVADITYIPTREGWLYLAVVEWLSARKMDPPVSPRSASKMDPPQPLPFYWRLHNLELLALPFLGAGYRPDSQFSLEKSWGT